MDKLQFSSAPSEIWKLIGSTNKYIDLTMPWVLAKDESKKDRLATVIVQSGGLYKDNIGAYSPFMPNTPALIWTQLGMDHGQGTGWEDIKQFGKAALPE
jgi:methionyl-tRNA synthetase